MTLGVTIEGQFEPDHMTLPMRVSCQSRAATARKISRITARLRKSGEGVGQAGSAIK
jgi:hypothetical protein